MKTPTIATPRDLLGMLDANDVEFMVYDSRQDTPWIRFFSENPGWVIDSEDHGTVVFVRCDKAWSK